MLIHTVVLYKIATNAFSMCIHMQYIYACCLWFLWSSLYLYQCVAGHQNVINLQTPDRKGEVTDITLGYDSLDMWMDNPTFFGCLVMQSTNFSSELAQYCGGTTKTRNCVRKMQVLRMALKTTSHDATSVLLISKDSCAHRLVASGIVLLKASSLWMGKSTSWHR